MKARVTLRRALLSDLDAIVDIYNQAVLDGTATCDLSELTPAERLDWFQAHTGRYAIWVADRSGAILGWTALSPYDRKACFVRTGLFATYVRRDFRGQGIGSTLRAHLICEARELGFHTLVNRVWANNYASIALARKYGFTQVGHMREIVYKNGHYIDCLFFQIILNN